MRANALTRSRVFTSIVLTLSLVPMGLNFVCHPFSGITPGAMTADTPPLVGFVCIRTVWHTWCFRRMCLGLANDRLRSHNVGLNRCICSTYHRIDIRDRCACQAVLHVICPHAYSLLCSHSCIPWKFDPRRPHAGNRHRAYARNRHIQAAAHMGPKDVHSGRHVPERFVIILAL